MSRALYLCTQCHYTGLYQIGGSGMIELILWCCGLVPGLLYSSWRRGQKGNILCPKCGNKSLIPLDTPRAKELIGQDGINTATQQYAADMARAKAKGQMEKGLIVKLLLLIAFAGFLILVFS